MNEVNDTDMGEFVYCRSHVGPHNTGWCSVDKEDKIPLAAKCYKQAMEEVFAMGLHIYNYCDVCHKYIANEPWMRERMSSGKIRLTCPEHDA